MLEELGIRPVINAAGSLTLLGGSILEDDVLAAMKEVAGIYVDMTELQTKAGAFIAQLAGAEAAYITGGAAAGLVLSVAACMTKGETSQMTKLPRTENMANEVIVQRSQRNTYDYNLEIAGARIREIGHVHATTTRDLEDAINEKTAAVVYFVFDPQDGVLRLDTVLEIAHKHGIPVIVDAAAELPPKENFAKFVRMRADLVLFSGGKDIGAPNDTGIILGRRDLVALCMRLGPQSYEPVDSSRLRVYIGRPMKVSKEDIVALLVAIKRYLATDQSERFRKWDRMIEYMLFELSKCNRIAVRKVNPSWDHSRPACIPRVEVELLNSAASAEELVARLKQGDPSIHAYAKNGRLYVNPQCLREGEERIVAGSLSRLLSDNQE